MSASEQIHDQLRAAGVTDVIGPQDIYAGDERVGATVQRAYADGAAWIQASQNRAGTGTPATLSRPEAAAACEPARPVTSQLEAPGSEGCVPAFIPGE